MSAVVGQHVLLSCAIAGDPFPQYTWMRAAVSRPLTSGGDFELLQKEDVVSLLIRSQYFPLYVTKAVQTLDQQRSNAELLSSSGEFRSIMLETT